MPAIQQNNEYIAFISYRHKPLDSSVAKKIQRSIESFTVPAEYRDQVGGKRLGKVFRDEDELPASANLSESIRDALDHARFLIVICTPDLPQSHWCEEEIRYFLKTHDRDQLLAVLAEGEPQDSFSPYMLHTFDEEGNITGNVEPLAANLKQPYKKEFIRLCAAMLGCSFDALWQRDRRRKANIRMGVVAGTALLMTAFTSVVLVKNRQINAQKEQIIEQNALSEKRMSEALVQSGTAKLEAFDRKGALTDAVQAMDIEDPSLVDPHVDLLLADALGAYRLHSPVTQIFYEQQQDIVDLKITDDTSSLLITDSFGKITCVDRATGVALWSHTSNDPWVQIYTQNLGEKVLYKTKDTVRCLSIKDGSELWSYAHHYGIFFQVLSHDGSLFAIMDRISDDPDNFSFDAPLYLILLSTEDGSEYGRISLTNEAYSDKDTNYDDLFEQGGAFSENDKQLLFSVHATGIEEGSDDMDQEVHLFYVVDLDTLEKAKLGRSSYPQKFFYGMDVSDDASQAFIAFHSIQYGGVVACQCIKGEDGYDFDINTINHDISTKDSGTSYGFYGQYPRFHMLSGLDFYLISSDNRLFLLRKSDNFLFKSYGLDEGTVRSISWKNKEKRTLELATANGYVIELTIKDPEADGSVISDYFLARFDQDQVCLAVRAGDHLSSKNSQGQYYTVSESDPGRILSTHYETDPHAQVIFAGADTLSYASSIDCPPDTPWMMISGSDHTYMLLNTETQETKSYRNTDLSTGAFLIDEDHILYGPDLYTISNGRSEHYCEVDLTELSLLSYPSDHFRLHSGEIVSYDTSYYIGARVLHFWIDRHLSDVFLIRDYDFETSSFLTSPSGWIANYGVSGEDHGDGTFSLDETPSFTCLNVLTGETIKIQEELSSDQSYVLNLGNTSSQMALYAQNQLRLYDLKDGSTTLISEAYKEDGVACISFSDDDRYLLVLTQTGRLDIYDLETLELKYAEPVQWIQDEIRSTFQLGRYTDSVQNLHAMCLDSSMEVFFGRYDSISNGILLDTTHWVLTSEMENLKGYDPATGEIYFWNNDTLKLCTFPHYSRADLKAWAEEELNK